MDATLFPENKLLIDGVDIALRFNIIMTDTYELGLPEPKISKVDIPGSGSLDLTEALFGDVAYDNRAQKFNYIMLGRYEDYPKLITQISNYLHGKYFEYQITMDLPYIYKGRFTIESNQHTPGYYLSLGPEDVCGSFTLNVDAEPWKLRERKVYSLNASGGKYYVFESGRRKVRPIVEVEQPTSFSWQGKIIDVPEGTYRLNDVLFTEGLNEMYINSFKLLNTVWEDLEVDGVAATTWEQASSGRWDDLTRRKSDDNLTAQSWFDLVETRYSDLVDQGKQWRDLNYKPDTVSGRVYISYDIEEL